MIWSAFKAFCLLCASPVLGALAGFVCGLLRFVHVVLSWLWNYNVPVDVKNQVFVVTGAAGGFGEAVTKRLVGLGAVVWAVDCVDDDKAAEVFKNITNGDKQIIYKKVDLRDTKAITAFVSDMKNKGGVKTVFALLNNAGVAIPGACIQNSTELLNKTMSVNLYAAVQLQYELFAQGMFIENPKQCVAGKAPTKSRIVNVTSVAGLVSASGLSAYNVSKFSLEALSDCTRMEHAEGKHALNVSAIEPYFAATGIYSNILDPEQKENDLSNSILKERYAEGKKKFQKALSNNSLMTADFVAKTIVEALVVAVPQDRYMVSPASKEVAMRLMMHLPNYFGIVDSIKAMANKSDKV